MQLNGIPNHPVSQGEPSSGQPDPEVVPAPPQKPKRRQFTARFKLRVLEDADRLPDGEVGAYLRKMGLYWSHLSDWRRLRSEGALGALGTKPRGRRAEQSNTVERELTAARREADELREELRQTKLVLEVQKKVLSLCENASPSKRRPSC